jgi:hypothetical protein
METDQHQRPRLRQAGGKLYIDAIEIGDVHVKGRLRGGWQWSQQQRRRQP